MPRSGSTTALGYGSTHQKLRAQVKRIVDAGQAWCWRCGDPLEPGKPFDLGHDDDNRSIYRGPEHPYCNRSAGARKRNGTTEPARPRTSQPW